jgi:hypothetical protein
MEDRCYHVLLESGSLRTQSSEWFTLVYNSGSCDNEREHVTAAQWAAVSAYMLEALGMPFIDLAHPPYRGYCDNIPDSPT